MSEWQDIATAPKDGTPILIWQPSGHSFGYRGRYQPEWNGPVRWYDDARWAIGYWRPWGGWGNRNSSEVVPTHWQPLPAPPLAGEGTD